MQTQSLRAWKLGLTTSQGVLVLQPKYDMDACMTTLFEVRLKACIESWVEQKARPNESQHKSQDFAYINSQYMTKSHKSHTLMGS